MEEEKPITQTINIDLNFDMETLLYRRFKDYLNETSKYPLLIFNKAPKQFADKFPIVIFEEINNRDQIQYRTLNDRGRQWVSRLTYKVEIYTTDLTVDGEKIASKVIMAYLKRIIFEFFEYYGFDRTDCSKGETSNYQIDRVIILEQINECNWNRIID